MLASIQIILAATALAVLVYWTIPSTWPQARRALLIAVSGLLIFIFNPRALVLMVAITALAYGLIRLSRRFPERGWIPWLITLPMVIDAISPISNLLPIPTGAPRSPVVQHLVTLGLSYYTLKLYGSIKLAQKTGHASFSELLTNVLFFPAVPMGPIDYAPAFSNEALSRPLDVGLLVRGVLRIGLGLAKAFVIAGAVAGQGAELVLGAPLSAIDRAFWAEAPFHVALAFALVAFVNLYLNFSGFTDIAIGSGWMFNLRLTENFNYPLISHSIQNFWQRWHLSLGGFITRYLFLPIVRATGRPFASMVATFTLIGLWHQVSLGYLIWGIGHGTALALYAQRAGEARKGAEVSYASPRTWLSVAATLLFVAILSAIANQPSDKALGAYLLALVRPWHGAF